MISWLLPAQMSWFPALCATHRFSSSSHLFVSLSLHCQSSSHSHVELTQPVCCRHFSVLWSDLWLLPPQVTGVVLLSVGLWWKFMLGPYMLLISNGPSNAPYVLTGTGVSIILFGLFGCFATCRGRPWMLNLVRSWCSVVNGDYFCIQVTL